MICWSNHRVEPTATAAPLGGAIKATRSVAQAVAVAHPGRSAVDSKPIITQYLDAHESIVIFKGWSKRQRSILGAPGFEGYYRGVGNETDGDQPEV